MLSIKSFVPNADSRKHWLLIILLCLFLEGVALFYQYQLDYLPCVLCVHVRMLLAAVLLVAIIGAIFPTKGVGGLILLALTLALWFWMLERSWQLLGVEMGFIMGECQMHSGLPAWLALEDWFPWIFRIHEPCGYTPYVVFKISMAHLLLALSILMSAVYTLSILRRLNRSSV